MCTAPGKLHTEEDYAQTPGLRCYTREWLYILYQPSIDRQSESHQGRIPRSLSTPGKIEWPHSCFGCQPHHLFVFVLSLQFTVSCRFSYAQTELYGVPFTLRRPVDQALNLLDCLERQQFQDTCTALARVPSKDFISNWTGLWIITVMDCNYARAMWEAFSCGVGRNIAGSHLHLHLQTADASGFCPDRYEFRAPRRQYALVLAPCDSDSNDGEL